MHYDAIVLGGGLYGCKVALALRASGVKKVLLVEPDNKLVGGATTCNQNRVHGGYHYPRSLQTADSAQKNYHRFLADFAPTIEANAKHIYAIGEGSFTTPTQFEEVMAQVGAPLRSIPVPHMFTHKVYTAYEVEEVVFNIQKMRSFLTQQLQVVGIERAEKYGRIVNVDDKRVTVALVNRGDWNVHMAGEFATANYVFNCTYRALADVGARIRTRLQYEIAEVALCHPPAPLLTTDITIMNGAFWSLMRYPSENCHALTHVTHTVHKRWFSDDAVRTYDCKTFKSAFPAMIEDAKTYCPMMAGSTFIGSLTTTRVVLADNEPDDGRPILWEHDERSPRIISVLGSKFNSVYDAQAMVEQGEWRAPRHKLNVRREGRRVLVGTGFVGQNLDAPGRFTDRVNSKNLDTLRGHYRQIVLAAPGAEKWRANEDPDADMESISQLQEALYRCTADEVLMVSTIDVHGGAGAYGEHRKFLESVVRQHFPAARIVRLPALYGPGLKKNVLFDLITLGKNAAVHPDSMFQWFDVRQTWDMFKRLQRGAETSHAPGYLMDVLPTPIPCSWLYEQVGIELCTWNYKHKVVVYNRGPYNITEEEVKRDLAAWIKEARC